MPGGHTSQCSAESMVFAATTTSRGILLRVAFQDSCCFVGTRLSFSLTPSSFTGDSSKPFAESPTPVRRIIVTAEPVTSIDVTSADMLAELEHSLTESGIELRFAEMKDPVKDKLKRFELFDRFGAADFYPTIGSAVDAYLEEHAVVWKP